MIMMERKAILIWKFKSIGAAVASVVAESVIAIVQLVAVRSELKPLKIIKEGRNYYIAGIVMGMVLFIVETRIKPSIINTGILIVAGGFAYILVLLIMKDDFLLQNIDKIVKMIVKRKKK